MPAHPSPVGEINAPDEEQRKFGERTEGVGAANQEDAQSAGVDLESL